MFVIAIIRFGNTAKSIDSGDEYPGVGSTFDVALAALMSPIGVSSLVLCVPRSHGNAVIMCAYDIEVAVRAAYQAV